MTFAEQIARDVAKARARNRSRHQYSEDSQSPGYCRCGLRKDEIDHEPAPAPPAAPLKFGEKPKRRL